MAATAAAGPPPGLVSNFVDPPSKAPIIYAVMSICLGLVTLLVAIRIYTRVRITKSLWWDDTASVLAWVFFIALLRVTFGAVENGGGVAIWNVPKTKYTHFIKYWNNIMIMARVDITLAKVAILLLYLRIFVPRQTGSRQMWFWIWFMVVFNVVYCLVLILLIQLQCVGHKTPGANGSCLDQHILIITASAINVITEVAILVVAVVAVWGLHMPLGRKVACVSVLSFGSAGIVFSLARLIWQSVTKNTNPTVYNMTVIMLATAETTVAIMAGCLPLLSSFYKYHFRYRLAQVTSNGRSEPDSERNKQGRKPHHPLSISTTELVSRDVALEELHVPSPVHKGQPSSKA